MNQILELREPKNKIAEFRIRLSRGQALTYEIKAALTLAMAFKILLDSSLLTSILLTILAFVGFFIIGYIDTKYLKLMQQENKLSTSKYNPHLNNIKKK